MSNVINVFKYPLPVKCDSQKPTTKAALDKKTDDDKGFNTIVSGQDSFDVFGESYQKYYKNLPHITPYWSELLYDKESLLSIKPLKFYQNLCNELPCTIRTVFDPFHGGGGASIGFALAGKKVIASDLDPTKRFMAKHNAKALKAMHAINFIPQDTQHFKGDALKLIDTIDADCIYLDPPWNGFGRDRSKLFKLSDFNEGFSGKIIQKALKKYNHVLLSVPKNIDLNELKAFGRNFRVIQCYVGKDNLFTTLYFEPKYYT